MKRLAPLRRSVGRTGDVRKDLSSAQLARIGAIAIIWNEIEFLLDTMVGTIVLQQGLWLNVTSRFALRPKYELARAIAADALLPAQAIEVVNDAMRAAEDYYDYRNAVVHARVSDAARGIGEIIRRGARIQQTLMTARALDALYRHLALLRREMEEIVQIFYAIRRTGGLGMRAPDGREKQRLEREFLAWTTRAQRHRTRRLSLGPLPEFPP